MGRLTFSSIHPSHLFGNARNPASAIVSPRLPSTSIHSRRIPLLTAPINGISFTRLSSFSGLDLFLTARKKWTIRSSGDSNSQQTLVDVPSEATESAPGPIDSSSNGLRFSKSREHHCTADELHFVDSSDWKLALWRYRPSSKAVKRQHPVLLLSGIATNAIGYDLDHNLSLARSLSESGFDTWTLEVRGMGFSHLAEESPDYRSDAPADVDGDGRVSTSFDTSGSDVDPLNSGSMAAGPSEEGDSRSMSVLQHGKEILGSVLSDAQQSAMARRISSLSDRLTGEEVRKEAEAEEQKQETSREVSVGVRARLERLLEERKKVGSSRLEDIGSRMMKVLADAQKTMGSFRKYDWDFDTLLFEDVPAGIKYIVDTCQPQDGKVLAVGHSMGGILLYSRLAVLGKDSQLAGVVTVASAMDYSSTNSSFKLLLPLETPFRLANVLVIPTRALARASIPLIMRPPYTLAWVGYNISAKNMMDPALLRKLLRLNFDSIPVKLLLQLASLFYPRGLKDRSGSVEYGKGLRDCQVPILALAGSRDLVCPPEAVAGTVKLFPEGCVKYLCFGGGEEDGPEYSHYDLLVSKLARSEVFPVITEFLVENDTI